MKRLAFLASIFVLSLLLFLPQPQSRATTATWFDTPLDFKLSETNITSPKLNYWNIPCNDLRHKTYYHVSGGVVDGTMDDCVMSTSYGFLSLQFGLMLAGTDTSYKFTTSDGAVVTSFMAAIPGTDDILLFNGGYNIYIYRDLPENIKPIYRFPYTTKRIDHYQLTNSLERIHFENGSNIDHIAAGSFSFTSDGHYFSFNEGQYQVLVDTSTLVAKKFGVNTLIVGGDPVTFTAIDSRAQTALIAATRYETIYKLYDLTNCQSNSNSSLPDNCPTVSLWEYLKDIPDFGRILSAKFVSNSSLELNIMAGKTGALHTDKYILSIPGQQDTSFQYLALGDSFASGEGARDYRQVTDTDDNHCHISEVSYPYLIKKTLSLSTAESIACSGAKIKDIILTDLKTYNEFGSGPQAKGKQTIDYNPEIEAGYLPGYRAQLMFVQKLQPKIVTMSIGGNDIDFGGIVKNCVQWVSTCYTDPTERDGLLDTIKNQFWSLIDLYNKIKENDPNVQLYIIGYPEIVAPNGHCAVNVHLNEAEIEFAQDLTIDLNKMIDLAAYNAGVHFVDVSHALYGHRLCETSSQDTAVNGLTVGNDSGLGPVKFIGNESYHPNAFGHYLLEQAILKDTKNFTASMQEPNPAIRVDHMESMLDPDDLPHDNHVYFQDNLIDSDLITKGTSINQNTNTQGYFLEPGGNYQITLHSTPVTIGTATAVSSRILHIQATIPTNTEPGYHTVHISGNDIDGNPIDVFKTVLISASVNDTDGDGIPNDQDKCNFVEPANIDSDNDGIDDSCDGYIGVAQKHETKNELVDSQSKTTGLNKSQKEDLESNNLTRTDSKRLTVNTSSELPVYSDVSSSNYEPSTWTYWLNISLLLCGTIIIVLSFILLRNKLNH